MVLTQFDCFYFVSSFDLQIIISYLTLVPSTRTYSADLPLALPRPHQNSTIRCPCECVCWLIDYIGWVE